MEPLLDSSEGRLILFPIKYEGIWKYYKQHLSTFWTAEEIRHIEEDKRDWAKLSDAEKNFVKGILAFFAASDNIVIENLAARFCEEVQIPEARQFYSIQILMEAIHSETYNLLIDRLVDNYDEKVKTFRAIENDPMIAKKGAWALKWINGENKFAERLIAFACVEKINFISSFAGIFWLRKRNLLPGVTKANEFIARDESLHGEFACYLYMKILNEKLSEERVHEIIREATELECEYVDNILPVDLFGLNAGTMKQYVRYIADHLCENLGCKKLYGDSNPYNWMETMGMNVMSNFFESTGSNYQQPVGSIDEEDEDF